MNDNCTKQFNFMKQYFLKNQIAKQLIPDDLNDIYPENFDEASTNVKHHQRFNSDQLTKTSLTKITNNQNNSLCMDVSYITNSIMSYKSILKTPKKNSNQKTQTSQKKVHFSRK